MPPATLVKESNTSAQDVPATTRLKNLFCFSHLRWNFVYQRPQHLLSRFASVCPVFFMEEPVFEDGASPHFRENQPAENVTVLVPVLPHGMNHDQVIAAQKDLLDQFISSRGLLDVTAWYYTPMALPFTRHLHFNAVVFDVMDELSAFKFAPRELLDFEQELLDRADVAFTGGRSIFNAKQHRHKNIHCYPSSIDKEHFAQSRQNLAEPEDQASIPHPRFGFSGVIDERFDIELLSQVAAQKPNWHWVIIGPVVKIDPAHLPQAPNIHYLGGKNYGELPAYFHGWDVATIPFALNESTKFISPTKTPEYLAAGKPVISTPITDVVDPYGNEQLVKIAASADEFVAAGTELLALDGQQRQAWLQQADVFLKDMSWQHTFSQMLANVLEVLPQR